MLWNFYNKDRTNTIIEKDDTQTCVEFYDLLSKYDDYKFNFTEFEINEFNKTLSAQSIRSVDESPYYNENLDFDQQSPEFWESF